MLSIKKKIWKDLLYRQMYNENEINSILSSLLANNKILSYNDRLRLGLNLFNNKNSRTRVKNRCIFSGRSRAQVNKLSRIKFKELAMNGRLAGVQRSSW